MSVVVFPFAPGGHALVISKREVHDAPRPGVHWLQCHGRPLAHGTLRGTPGPRHQRLFLTAPQSCGIDAYGKTAGKLPLEMGPEDDLERIEQLALACGQPIRVGSFHGAIDAVRRGRDVHIGSQPHAREDTFEKRLRDRGDTGSPRNADPRFAASKAKQRRSRFLKHLHVHLGARRAQRLEGPSDGLLDRPAGGLHRSPRSLGRRGRCHVLVCPVRRCAGAPDRAGTTTLLGRPITRKYSKMYTAVEMIQ